MKVPGANAGERAKQTLLRKDARRRLRNRRAPSEPVKSGDGRGRKDLRLLRATRLRITSRGFAREDLLQMSPSRRKMRGRALEPMKAADQTQADRVIAATLLSERSRDTNNPVPRIAIRRVRNKKNSVRNVSSKSNAGNHEEVTSDK